MKKILIIVGSIELALFSLNTNFAYAMGDKPPSPCAPIFFALGPSLECPQGVQCMEFQVELTGVYQGNTQFCRFKTSSAYDATFDANKQFFGIRADNTEASLAAEPTSQNPISFVFDIADPVKFADTYTSFEFHYAQGNQPAEKRIRFSQDIAISTEGTPSLPPEVINPIPPPDVNVAEVGETEGGGQGGSAVGGKPIPGLPKGPLGDLNPVVTTGEATGDSGQVGDEASLGSQESSESGIQSGVSGQNIPAAQFPAQTNPSQGGGCFALNPGAAYGFNLGWLILAGLVLVGLCSRAIKHQ